MVIKALTRKLLRDLWLMKAQVLTIALVMSGGAAAMVSFLSVVTSLERARDEFYIQGRFADAFSELKRAPLASLSFFDDKKSIDEYQARVSLVGRLWKADAPLPLIVRIQTYNNPVKDLNRLFLKQGRWPESNQNEVVISEAFFQGAAFHLDEEIQVIAEGQNQKYKIVGVAISPEFTYTLKPGSPLPDDKHFGILWGPYDKISKDFGFDRAYNSLVVRAAQAYPIQNVLRDIDQVLGNYGGLGAYGRDSQLSHFFVTDELRQQRTSAAIFPSVFLLVSGFLLNMILGRLVNSQREQVAVFRALGYSNNQITWHYLSYIVVIVFLGSVLGILLGFWQGQGMITMYKSYFRFLNLQFIWNWPAILLSTATNFLFAVLGVAQVLWRLRKLQPAEALRPQIPVLYKGRGFDRILRDLKLNPTTRMTLRSLLQRPGRTLISMIALACASVILILGIFWWDAVKFLINVHFNKVLKADTIVTFINPMPHSALLEIRQSSTILRAEGYRQIPVKIYFQNRHVLTTLEAVGAGQQLKSLLDENFLPVEVPSTGILLSRGWAEKLGLQVSDSVTIETLENIKKIFPMKVTRIVEDLIGSQAYIDQSLIQDLLQEGTVYNSLLLKVDSQGAAVFLDGLKTVPAVASVDNKLDVVRSFNESTAKIILIFAAALLFFAVLIAIGVIYNSARISLAEKSRTLASLRILGFTHQEIFKILLGEMLILTLISLPIGSVLGYFLAKLSVRMMRTESFRMPMYLEPRSFVYSIIIVILASLITSLFLKKQVRKLDIIATLKGQE